MGALVVALLSFFAVKENFILRCRWDPIRDPIEEQVRRSRKLKVLWREILSVYDICVGSTDSPYGHDCTRPVLLCIWQETVESLQHLEDRCDFWPLSSEYDYLAPFQYLNLLREQ